MSTVAEVSAKITADISGFTSAMRSASRAANDLKRETSHGDTIVDANAKPFIAAVDGANRHLDALQADAGKTIHVKGDVSGLNRGLDGVGQKAGKTSALLGGFGKVAMVGGVAAIGVSMLGDALGNMAGKAQESASISRTTEQIIKNTGGAAKISAEGIGALATSISQKTGVDDEAIQSGMNMLLTFQKVQNAGTGQAAVFDRASAAAVDLSKAGFGSITGASKMLGKALDNPTKGMTALGRAGVKFTDAEAKKIQALQKSGDMLGAQKIILDKVEGKVKGVAAAAASPMEKMATNFENLQETIGASLLPVINQLSTTLGPIFAQIGPPLAQVVGVLGGAFATALSAIAPALGPISQAFAAIAGIVGGALSSVMTAITPVLTILAGVLSTLASSIGPILAPVLSTIAGLLSTILGAVAPLLQPLAQLIQTILGAAAPILQVVAGALTQVVQALMPIIGAITPILPLLGQLISMLGSILTPILQALTPVITIVAGVLANVLGRAIGLTEAGIGGLILVFSYLAPFVLRNVTTPVVNAFLTMAANIVGAAAQAFSWVPGLGDKLGEAKSAIDTFKTDATAGIENAASTIETQGRAIGESMRQAGTDMLVNGPPEAEAAGKAFGTSYAAGMNATVGTVQQAAGSVNTSTLAGIAKASGQVQSAGEAAGAAAGTGIAAGMQGQQSAVQSGAGSLAAAAQAGISTADMASSGRTAGNGLADGLLSAIRNRAGEVAAAAYSMGARAAQAVKNGAAVKSPSAITIEAGKGIVDGVTVGLKQRAGSALSAAAAFGAMVGKTAAVGISMGRMRARVVQEAQFVAADKKDAVAEARKALKEAKGAAAKAKAQRDLTRALWEYSDAVRAARSAGTDFDNQFKTAALDAARDKLDALKDKARQTIDAMLGFGKVTTLAVSNGVQPMAGAIVANLQQRLAAVRAFGKNLQALRAAGLNDAALQDIIAEGPIAGNQYAEALLADLNAGGSAISSINTLRSDLITAAGAVGDISALSGLNADNPYAGSAVASATVNVNDGAVVINIDGSISTADRTAIKRDVQTAVTAALAELAREVARR